VARKRQYYRRVCQKKKKKKKPPKGSHVCLFVQQITNTVVSEKGALVTKSLGKSKRKFFFKKKKLKKYIFRDLRVAFMLLVESIEQ
jgi:hypothetical protein